MKRIAVFSLVLVLTGAVPAAVAQDAPAAARGLVGSWTLAGLERDVASGEPTLVRGSRGLLVIDDAGHVFEFFSAASSDTAGTQGNGPLGTLARFGGFWGTYDVDAEAGEVDESAGRIRFEAEAGVSPSVRSLGFSRDFTLTGDRLVLTSTDEPQAQADTRWTWQRVPTVENLSPAYRQVVGFWRHVEERQVEVATGDVLRSNERAPSVIVYTPSGFVGVHFPSLGRTPFDREVPTADEAQAALRGYIGYFGTLNVYPGEVSHNLLSGVSPETGSILRRYADISGDELVVRLQGGGASGEPPRTVTEVVLRRLSGAEEMLPAR